jgi:hypothetical protein
MLQYPSVKGSSSSLPDYDYPTPIIVKNTFIDTPLDRPVSLDGFLQERRIQSCPVDTPKDREEPIAEEDEEDLLSMAPQLRRAATTAADTIAAAAADTAAAVMGWWNGHQPQQQHAVPDWNESYSAQQEFVQNYSYEMPPTPEPHTAPPVLLLSEALAPPPMGAPGVGAGATPNVPLGSPEMPTIGSMEHFIGNCKPCAFFHKRGCSNGVQCSFCHLCDSSEKKRRQKEKVQQLREMRRQGVTPA